ncbi:MAG: Asp-tRNA(Asn)/Glu-tRNA(Gln) amidotransferase subunit GatC [Sorangiineae bacterium]|nr:Asp-tRNA(Asn)/Glu-tRNA(Gln) amidotransferase subunit GatC [Polyangiaceae bacterium]MEB2324982.1 Asp-tRNA(Asn)/Glu-tRNA(Gln) amidotransferase subunit GatC [Sorangiineae bacterium]
MSLTREEVLRAARLARLELTEPEIARFIGELDRIVAYVGELAALDATSSALTARAAVDDAPLRDDAHRASLPHDAVLAAAPRAAGGAFAVPAFVEEP